MPDAARIPRTERLASHDVHSLYVLLVAGALYMQLRDTAALRAAVSFVCKRNYITHIFLLKNCAIPPR